MWNDALPRNGITNWSVFYGTKFNGVTAGRFYSWMKPAGCSWVYIFAIAAGGGGAKTSQVGNTGGASGGGGSGSVTRLLIPATFLPDIIYVQPGVGGIGATSPGNAASSSGCYISIAPDRTAQNLILFSGSGGAGIAGTGTTGGSGGTGGAVAASNSALWMNIGLFTSIAGQAGGNGGTSSAGADVTFGSSGLPITAGAGGGYGTFSGGNVIGAGLLPTRSGGSGSTGGRGDDGFRVGQTFAPGFKLFPLLFSGGGGGGGASSGASGSGGYGGWGCGGGGGGTGPSASGVTSGNGGDGGDGLVLIGAF